MYIDTHCHLYFDDFNDDRSATLEKAKAAEVAAIILPAVDVSTSNAAQLLAKKEPICHAAFGVHPAYASSFSMEVLQPFYENAVAVGECGLDEPAMKNGVSASVQEEVFSMQLDIAMDLNLPVIIHSRGGEERAADMVLARPKLRGVFHCYTGPLSVAQRLVHAGWMLGVTGIVTFPNAASVRDTFSQLPLESLLLETDAPYLAPVPRRGMRAEPSDIPTIAASLSTLFNKEQSAVAAVTTENAKRLFSIG